MTAGQFLPGKTGQRRFPISKFGDFLKHYVFGHQAPGQFLDGLRSGIKDSLDADPDAVIKAIKEEAKNIENVDSGLVQDAPSRGHLELCSSVLSAYNNLLPLIGDKESTVEFLDQSMIRGVNTLPLRTSLSLMLDACRDNPDRLRDIFSWLMRQYGTTFGWTAPHEESECADSFSIEIQTCFYFNFFSAHDVPFLTPVLCHLDCLWFDMIDPKKHGFSFDRSRYQAQGYGAPKCVFPIVMRKKDSSS